MPPPDLRNLIIEYLTVNFSHCFSLIDLRPPDLNLLSLSFLAQIGPMMFDLAGMELTLDWGLFFVHLEQRDIGVNVSESTWLVQD